MAGEIQKKKKTSGSNDATASDVRGMADQFEAMLDEYMVKKAPFQIPTGGKEFIVKIAPYLVVISAVLVIPALLALLGLTAVLTPFAMMGGYSHFGTYGLISGLFSLAALIVELMAVKGLFARTHAAWRLVYYASLISLAGSILSFNIVGGIVSAIIGWYILFQVKSLYKNK